jgi:hypothetical protein
VYINFGIGTLTNCTISGNSANNGGGVETYEASVTVINCTVTGNTASNNGGGVDNFYSPTSSITLINTIVAGNTAQNGNGDIGSAVTGNNNLIGASGSGGLVNGVSGNIVGVANPLLGPLGYYGGPTETIPLLPGSRAINAGTSGLGIPTTDQRGMGRVGATDIGAFESQGFTITEVSGSSQSANLGNAFDAALEVLVTADDPLEPVAGGIVCFHAPSSGASAKLSGLSALIGANGMASIIAIANEIAGSYQVTASTLGAPGSQTFQLTNTVPPPVNITVKLTISYGGFVFNRKTGQFSQSITIKNTSGSAIVGPIELVLLNLKTGSLVNQSGTTQGNPYITILSTGSLAAGASITFSLVFADPTLAAISYTGEFLMGVIPPPIS